MRQFFKFMFASMVGFILSMIILFFLLLGLISGMMLSLKDNGAISVSNNSILEIKFENEIRAARQFFFKKYKGTDLRDANDETSLQFIDDNLDYQQKVIEIRRKYNDQFLKVISAQQLAELNKAEREFKQMLIKRLERRGRGGRFNERRGGY